MSTSQLQPFSEQAQALVKDGIYEHYKGMRYRLISVGRHSETLEEMVVYQALYGDQDVWIRPLDMFVENVEIKGESVPRFKAL